MEEVWKDITLPSLNDHPADSIISPGASNLNFPGTILLDFLARPGINKESPTPRTSDVSNDVSLAEGTTLFGSRLPTPGTILSLNSGSDMRYAYSGDPLRSNPTAAQSFGSPHNSPFHGFGSSEVSHPFGRKRAPESTENSNDRRYKRMMKNRESAARSRARKQAYTTELELEVAHLQEVNAKLRKQQEKLLSSTDQLPKKTSLPRTLTAPF